MSDKATSPLNREIDTKVLVWSTLEISYNCETTTVLPVHRVYLVQERIESVLGNAKCENLPPANFLLHYLS